MTINLRSSYRKMRSMARFRTKSRLRWVALLMGLTGDFADTGHCAAYTFQNIASTGDGFLTFFPDFGPDYIPSISASGSVAFHGVFQSGIAGIFRGDGGPLTTI